MNPISSFGCRLFVAVIAAGILRSTPAHAQASLQANLTPTVVITGPLGSLQQVQYSTNVNDPNGWTLLATVRMDAPVKYFFDTTATSPQRFYRTQLIGVMDTNLVWIPAGTFLMGSPSNEVLRSPVEGPQTPVTLTQGFLMGRYELRLPELASYLTNYAYLVTGSNLQHPADNVIWEDATNYCALRTAYERAQGMIPSDWAYRLPTEAEWEYACRAGTGNPFSVGNELRNDTVRSDAWFDGTNPYPTNLVVFGGINPATIGVTNVGSFLPNAFGLYDMHGNVPEWCLDTYSGNPPNAYPGVAITNPVAPRLGSLAICRGGGATDPGYRCRSAARRVFGITEASNRVGIRLVLSPTNSPVLPN